MRTPRLLRSATPAAIATAALAVGLFVTPAQAAAGGVPVPADGSTYFGVFLANDDTPSGYQQRSGLSPAVYGHFAPFPLTSTAKQNLAGAVDGIRAAGGKLFLTLEPHGGLGTVTAAAAADLASTVAGYNATGVEVFVRFAHEMNGSWYPWGQRPNAYVSAFRTVADALHQGAPSTAVVWAPNYGGGYPYLGGTYSATSGSADHAALDTNGNGTLSMADDPYAPYYPGDAYVDWVALTHYHFGHAWPYGENEVPEPGKFGQQLRGTYTGNGSYEDQSALPDFYQQYAVLKGKPLAVAETGALYNETPPTAGASELSIKSAWIDQVYGSQSLFPQLKLVNWFEIRKIEAETKSYIDWRASARPDVAQALRARVTGGTFVFASAPQPVPEPALTAPGAPTSLGTSSSPNRIVVSWKAPTNTGGSPITGYVACRVGSSSCFTLSATASSASFTSLARRTTYTFSVRAVNKIGQGTAANVSGTTK